MTLSADGVDVPEGEEVLGTVGIYQISIIRPFAGATVIVVSGHYWPGEEDIKGRKPTGKVCLHYTVGAKPKDVVPWDDAKEIPEHSLRMLQKEAEPTARRLSRAFDLFTREGLGCPSGEFSIAFQTLKRFKLRRTSVVTLTAIE